MSNVPVAPTYRSGTQSVAPTGTAAPGETRSAALQFLSHLAAEVSSGIVDLPCFPDVVIRIRRTLADPQTTTEKTVVIVGAEPRLAARLLQTANSAAFNHTGKPLTDLRTAITRLGHQLVQSAAMAFAVQQMRDEQSLRSISKPLRELWRQSVVVASICKVVAERTKISADEAFLTGLVHGIGRLYVMVRAAGKSSEFAEPELPELVSAWHASIGKAILENWGFAEEMSEAVGNQDERGREHKRRHEADLSDIVIASIALAEMRKMPAPRVFDLDGVGAFAALGLAAQDCNAILALAGRQLELLQEALG